MLAKYRMYIEVDKAGFSLSTYICLAEYLLCYKYKYLGKLKMFALSIWVGLSCAT